MVYTCTKTKWSILVIESAVGPRVNLTLHNPDAPRTAQMINECLLVHSC